MKTKILVALVVAVAAILAATQMNRERGEAQAKETPTQKVLDLVDEITREGPLNRHLMALEKLRKLNDTGVESELAKLAKGSDLALAAFATRALGKRKTGSAKTTLKGMIESSALSKDIRMGAMSVIALHWKDERDLVYLDAKSKSDTEMKAHYGWLKTKVYKK